MKHNILITILVILALTVIGLVAYIALMPQPAPVQVPVETRGVQKTASTDPASQDTRDTVDDENDFVQFAQYNRQIDLFHLDDKKKHLVDETPKEHSVECEIKMNPYNERDALTLKLLHDRGVPGLNNKTVVQLYQNDYNVVDGCLYKNGKRAMKYSLYLYGYTDFFGMIDDNNVDAKLGTTNLTEWFRFSRDGKLYIFLMSGEECGGCVYNGRYLQIDRKTGVVEGKYVNMPYVPYLIVSPDGTRAIRSVMDDNFIMDLYLYDLASFTDIKKLYTVPKGKVIYFWGGLGPWMPENTITWADDSVYVQLFHEDKVLAGDWGDDVRAGSPVKIDLK